MGVGGIGVGGYMLEGYGGMLTIQKETTVRVASFNPISI